MARFRADGYAILPNLYHEQEVAALLACVEAAPANGPNFRRSHEVFAIRNLLGEVPGLWLQLYNARLRVLLRQLFPQGCQLVKAIYFDKPAQSNWLVAWHQDLMIQVNQRADLPGFGPWTSKGGEVAVLPPAAVLDNIVTVRVHLDDCDASNGGLKVVPASHKHGVLQSGEVTTRTQTATVCEVPAGGAMLMKPLLLHASNRSTSARSRRVVHLEFSSLDLPNPLQWRERLPVQ
jgi:hypothetical protein